MLETLDKEIFDAVIQCKRARENAPIMGSDAGDDVDDTLPM